MSDESWSAHFADDRVNHSLLRQRAYNFRWAEQPDDVIPLTAADHDFPPPPAIKVAIGDYLKNGPLSYGPAEGLPEFRAAIAMDLQQGGVPARSEQVLITDGAASALFLIARALLKSGDEALIFDPVDFLFERAINAANAYALRVPFHRKNGVNIQKFKALARRPKVQMIWLCAPHNPYGAIITDDQLHEIVKIAEELGLWIVSDEVWLRLFYERRQTHTASLPKATPRTFTVSGFSKCFGLAGLRVGYIHCPNHAATQLLIKCSHMISTAYGASTLSQIAAMAGLKDCQEWSAAFRAHLTQQRHLISSRLSALPGLHCDPPESTYLASPYIDHQSEELRYYTSDLLAEFILKTARVAVVPGNSRFFGPSAEGLIRLSFATSKKVLSDALTRIEESWSKRHVWITSRKVEL